MPRMISGFIWEVFLPFPRNIKQKQREHSPSNGDILKKSPKVHLGTGYKNARKIKVSKPFPNMVSNAPMGIPQKDLTPSQAYLKSIIFKKEYTSNKEGDYYQTKLVSKIYFISYIYYYFKPDTIYDGLYSE